jgi:hypothetical protein
LRVAGRVGPTMGLGPLGVVRRGGCCNDGGPYRVLVSNGCPAWVENRPQCRAWGDAAKVEGGWSAIRLLA